MKSVRLLLAAATLALPFPGRAQERLPVARPSADEVRAIRLLVEKQGRQIDELRQALDELSKIVQLKDGARLSNNTFVPSQPPNPNPNPNPPPAEPTSEPPPAEPKVERGEPVSSPHTVAKGETLTSIAKHYNVSITDLHKANKITDDRKLQIGQVLKIPTKPAETPTVKKETP